MRKTNTFHITVVWEMYGHYIMEATSLDEAKEMALDDMRPLPDDSDYVSGSIYVDDEASYELF